MRAILIILLGFSPFLTGAQNTLKVKSYSVDQGLPQSTIWDILQDDYGFLWISTADGLCRFDGYTFNTYRNNPDDSLSIGGNTMHLMSKDNLGNLWLTHEKGLDHYKSTEGKFYNKFRYNETKTLGLNKTIGTDKKEHLWVWITGEGLQEYNTRTGQLINTYKPEPSFLSKPAQHGFIDYHSGKIILAQNAPYLVTFDPVTRRFETISLPSDWNAFSILQQNDSVYLAGASKGVIRLHVPSNEIETISFYSLPEARKYDLFVATSLLHHSGDEFWVGTNHGIFIYHDNLHTFASFYHSVSGSKERFFLVQELFKDKSGNIWIGTNGDGLKKYSPHTPPWKHYRSNTDRSDIVKSVYSDDKDLVFVGYFQNGLDIFSKSKGLIRKVRKGNALPSDNVYAIQGINDEELFIGFSDNPNTFGVYNYKKNTFHDLTDEVLKSLHVSSGPGNSFPFATKSRNGNIIFCYHSYLMELSFNEGNDPVITLIHTFDNEILNTVFIDSQDNLWAGTMNGYYFRNANGEWKKGNTVIRKQVKSINEDKKGNIWLGTVSGLYVFEKASQHIISYRIGDELVNDFIYGILRDDSGNLWFSHNKGLTSYDVIQKDFRHFSVDDGLQANEFNTGAFFKSPSGELFFGGINGTNSFYPSEIKNNLEKPVVQLTRIEVNDKLLVDDRVPWSQKEITLDYLNNTVAFEIAGLEFTEPVKNQYAWRMNSLDRDWVQAGNRRFARYANIQPGQYTFEVKASNNDGLWNENPTAINIIITPPYWQTWWFKTLMIVIFAVIVGVIAFLISRQRYKRKIAELLVQQKIQHDRERISRDLHDNVGAMVSFVGTKVDWLLRHQPFNEETTMNLKVIKDSASNTLTGLRETIWTLQEKAITNTDLADKIKVYAKSHLLMPSSISDEIEHEQIMNNEVVLNVYRACQEIINNINKHSEASLVQIRFSNHQSLFELDVVDNGKGFQDEEFKKRDHYGLSNIKLRLEEVGATVSINSIINQGTNVKITCR